MKPETFLLLEESLTAKLLETWQPIRMRIDAQILQAVSNDDPDAAQTAIDKIKIERSLIGNHEYARLIGRGATRFGASRLHDGDPEATTALDQPGTKQDIGKSASQMKIVLADASTEVRRKVEQLVYEELENRRLNKIQKDITTLAEGLGGKFASGESSINLASSLHTSRLAGNGYCVEAKLLQIKTCMVNEVLDVRTCPVCHHMDKTVFSVERTHTTIQKALNAETVDELKRAMPWPGQSNAALEELSRMSVSEMETRGYSPPFHPLCRGFLDVVTSQQEEEPTPVENFLAPPTRNQLETRLRAGVVPRSGNVSLDGLENMTAGNSIVSTLKEGVERYGWQINNIETVSRGNFLTLMDYSADTGQFTYKINKTKLNRLGDKTTVDAMLAAGADDGAHLARNLEDSVTHDYGRRGVAKKATERGDLDTTYPGVSRLADQGLIESGGELFLKRSTVGLTVDEGEFLEALL